ncbi:hypothetical protein ACFY7C_12060 [Streptomyces sp. NPDC012769]|uniref:hypothetical protein n=1 Tax=Streptomyces sp. NPDC012769 TaxID=3364848 RepID=UPI0036B04C54
MTTFEPVTGDYADEERLPLLNLSEARQAVVLLLHLADDTVEGQEAERLARDLGARLPAPE